MVSPSAVPHVGASKHSEHGNEKDKGVLVCVSHGYPLPNTWVWLIKDDMHEVRVCFCHFLFFFPVRVGRWLDLSSVALYFKLGLSFFSFPFLQPNAENNHQRH